TGRLPLRVLHGWLQPQRRRDGRDRVLEPRARRCGATAVLPAQRIASAILGIVRGPLVPQASQPPSPNRWNRGERSVRGAHRICVSALHDLAADRRAWLAGADGSLARTTREP